MGLLTKILLCVFVVWFVLNVRKINAWLTEIVKRSEIALETAKQYEAKAKENAKKVKSIRERAKELIEKDKLEEAKQVLEEVNSLK